MNTNATTEETGNEGEAGTEGQVTEGAATEVQQGKAGEGANKQHRPIQPRINELTRDRANAERERDYWKSRAEASERAAAPKEEPKKAPVPGDFETYEEYVEAAADFRAEQKIDKRLEEREQQTTKRSHDDARAKAWNDREATVKKHHADYDEVMGSASHPTAPHVLQEIIESDMGPDVALHLAKNPDVLAKLNKMTPTQVAREIGRIEATLPELKDEPAGEEGAEGGQDGKPAETRGQQPAAARPAPAARTTKAPAPVKPGGSNRSTEVPLEKMPMDDYVKARKAQGARWVR